MSTTTKMKLSKNLTSPRWKHTVSTIKKGTEVEVIIEGKHYTVKHPTKGVHIMADKSYFETKEQRGELKIKEEAYKLAEDVCNKINNTVIDIKKLGLYIHYRQGILEELIKELQSRV